MIKQYKDKRKKRHLQVRAKIKGTAIRPRLSVFRSNKYIYAQLIDDTKGETLVAASDQGKQLSPSTSPRADNKQVTKTAIAHLVGQELGRRALKAGIQTVVFDRGGYKYHGRVKALAEGAREGGLKF